MQPYKLSATDAALLLQDKQISSLELVCSCLQRIKEVDGEIGAFITVTEETAITAAKESDIRRAKGETLGVFDGIPYALKDNICTKDIKTTCASKMLQDFVPPYSATVYKKLQDVGGVLLGKTNLDEFAMGSSCENSALKITRNPIDVTRVPGGSSGGSAAAVAAQECPVALGSDTGGSIRQPAGFCGVFGLKPTYGAVSRYGLVAFASSLDQIGPLSAKAADLRLMSDIIYGRDTLDATSCKKPLSKVFKPLSKTVFGIPKEYFGDGIEPRTKACIDAAIKRLEAIGAKFTELSLPTTEYALSAYYIISSAEASSNLARFDGVKYGFCVPSDSLSQLYKKTRSLGFGDEVKRRILLGTYVLSSGYYDAYYKRAKLLQQQIKEEFVGAFTKCDVLLTPISPTPAFKLGEKNASPLLMYAADICTVNVNLAGLPAVCVPCAEDSDKLPIGMQFIGKEYSDYSLISLAEEYEMLCSDRRT